jgi:Xaa-Pro aminopeptidase
MTDTFTSSPATPGGPLIRVDRHLVADRLGRLRDRLASSDFDAVLVLSPANVDYATGYRSVSAAVHGTASMGVLLTGDQLVTVGPVADTAPAFAAGIDESQYVAYGRFYFESVGGTARATALVDEHPDYGSALTSAVRRAGLNRSRIGIDQAAVTSELRLALVGAFPDISWVDASDWLSDVRAQKLPGEVAILEYAGRLAERAIEAAIEFARPGISERQLATVVSQTMVAGGADPRFVVVTSGERSGFADALPTDRLLQKGDLLRFDVGGTVEGYWSDIGRTAVLGAPSARQQKYYDAIRAGVDTQLEHTRPGITGAELFDIAVQAVQDNGGPAPYRRQHCGHGIGMSTYEPVLIRPGSQNQLRPGMVFCYETPYYELGWGGMMVEDTLVVTDTGYRMLTGNNRDLIVIDA